MASVVTLHEIEKDAATTRTILLSMCDTVSLRTLPKRLSPLCPRKKGDAVTLTTGRSRTAYAQERARPRPNAEAYSTPPSH